jgi:hypothetical protein
LPTSRRGSRLVGFDPEGGTRGLDLTVRAELRNESAVVFFPSRTKTNATFALHMNWKRPTKIPLD